ncbi:MAG: N4-gp56 family major capsid protein [Rheinheimera sp.]|nr:N4-gp56 family major capsid protein [Rheinheimera sp.]
MSNNFGDISPGNAAKAMTEALKHTEPVSVLTKLAKSIWIGFNETKVARFRRIIPLAPKSIALTEGVTPTGSDFRYENVEISLVQLGDYMPTTDVLLDLHDNPVGKDMWTAASEQGIQTIEQWIWATVTAGTSVQYANNVAGRSSVVGFLNKSGQQIVTRTLARNKAKKLRKMLSGSPDHNTTPIEAAFICVTHTDMAPAIRAMEGFTPVAEYGQRLQICDEELGSVDDVRYILTPWATPIANAGGAKGSGATECISTGGTNADVYPAVFFGEDAFGALSIKAGKQGGKMVPSAGSITPQVVNPKASASDPLGQRGSIGWKCYFQSKILNESWIVRGEFAAPKTP